MKTYYRVEAGQVYKNNESSDYELFDLNEELTINDNSKTLPSYVRYAIYEYTNNFEA
jgi:hypothetical protein